MGQLLEYMDRSYISGVQNVSLGPTDPPRLVRFMMSSTAVYIATYPRMAPQGDSVNHIINLNKRKWNIIWLWCDISLTCYSVYPPLVSIQWSSFRFVAPPVSYVSVYYTMMDSHLLSIHFCWSTSSIKFIYFSSQACSLSLTCHISLRRKVLSKIHISLKKKNGPFVIDKFFPFLFVTRHQNVIDFIL